MILHPKPSRKGEILVQTPTVDRDLVVELTQELIRFRSINPPGDEEPVAEFLAGRLREFGLDAQIQPVEPGRANLIGRLPGSGDGGLVLTGHLDVVPSGEQPWAHPPFDAEMADGQIYGRGSADMKGGVAAIVAAAAALAKSEFHPQADLILAFTAGEETGLFGAKKMAERKSLQGAKYLVVAEPTDLNVFIAEKGVLWVDIRAAGRTAHGSMPNLGINAVSYIARLIPRLEAYPFPFEESRLLGKPTLSVNVIQGGNKTNVVPDLCTVSIDMRTVPSQSHEALVAGIRRMAGEVAQEFDPDLQVEVEVVHDEPPVETDRAEALVKDTVEAVQKVRGAAPEVTGVMFATDAAVLTPTFDLPMVICGPGAPGQAHQPDEHVSVEQLVQAAQIYADLAVRMLG